MIPVFPGERADGTVFRRGRIPALPTRANLAAWYKFNSGLNTDANGAVGQWDDLSGNARHLTQATGAAQPIKQGDGSVLFNGSSHYLQATLPFVQPETVYLLMRVNTWVANQVLIDGKTGVGQLYFKTSSPKIGAYVAADGPEANFPVGQWGVLCVVFNGANSVLQVGITTATGGNVGAGAMGGFTVGATRNGTAQSSIQVKEAVLYSEAHDAVQRSRVLKYLARVGKIAL